MTLLNTANKLYVGTNLVSKVYSGTNLVWTSVSGASVVAAWKAAVITAGGTVGGGRETVLTTLVNGLITDGVWAKLDRLWISAAENSQSALLDLVAQDQASAVNSPTFTIDRGYAGNASTSYVNTTFNPSTQGVQYTANSAHMSVWDNTVNSDGGATAAQTGAFDGTNICDLLDYTSVFGPIGFSFRLNSGGATLTSSPTSGFYVANRTSASALEGFQNGASVGTNPSAASGIRPNLSFFICGRNDSGAVAIPTHSQISAASYGAGLTGTQATAFYNRMRTYMTAVGVP